MGWSFAMQRQINNCKMYLSISACRLHRLTLVDMFSRQINSFSNDSFKTFKLKEFAGNNLEFDENGWEFAKKVETL